mmetsp:Transcript_11312/g.32163  ORF Transcript_11312/g.32163 Transcript_11312/m.32163 type:complete len:219 (-) Transcript_11312:631-1287(-)
MGEVLCVASMFKSSNLPLSARARTLILQYLRSDIFILECKLSASKISPTSMSLHSVSTSERPENRDVALGHFSSSAIWACSSSTSAAVASAQNSASRLAGPSACLNMSRATRSHRLRSSASCFCKACATAVCATTWLRPICSCRERQRSNCLPLAKVAASKSSSTCMSCCPSCSNLTNVCKVASRPQGSPPRAAVSVLLSRSGSQLCAVRSMASRSIM